MAASTTATISPPEYLSSSLSSLSRSRSTQSLIKRTYRQASQLYLTKRFKDALDALETIISPGNLEDSQEIQHDGTNGDVVELAPIAAAPPSTRTRVWVFYLSLLHAIVDLGSQEGKAQFDGDAARWRELAAKVREGRIWEEIVRDGYGGDEGEVDAEVVVNLATLLISHMPSQRFNQQRLESWLAAASPANAVAVSFHQHDGTASPALSSSAAIDTPKTLASRLKILELYTLHVLPANQEWDYAHSFIEMSELLDEERREDFVRALEELKEESDGTALRERELAARREQEMKAAADKEEEERARREKDEAEQRAAEEARRQIDKAEREAASKKPQRNAQKPNGAANNQARNSPTNKRTAPTSAPANSPTMLNRAIAMLSHARQNLNVSAISTRFLMFLFAFLILISRRDLRMRLRRALAQSWGKVRQTVGMGVKVSYV
ncbi:hypothetical protein MBLNU230_g7897t1 [Neophaeotheca triangularis]